MLLLSWALAEDAAATEDKELNDDEVEDILILEDAPPAERARTPELNAILLRSPYATPCAISLHSVIIGQFREPIAILDAIFPEN